MPESFLDWIVRFAVMCALNYSKIVIATTVAAAVMAAVLLILRHQVLKEESWLDYLGIAFATFAVQYGFRAVAAWQRGGDYSNDQARDIERYSQAIFSNLNSLFFVAAALALLYWLPTNWWRTRSARLLCGLFALSALAGLLLPEPWDRRFDALLSAAVLLLVSWAMYMNSGARQRRRWALLNLAGGFAYAVLHLIYAFVPNIAQSHPLADLLSAQMLEVHIAAKSTEVLDQTIFALAFLLKLLLFIGALLVVMRCLSAFSPAVSRKILEPVKTERGDFLASGGIVRAMAESIGADAAALCFRLPGTRRNEIVKYTWTVDGSVIEDGEKPLRRPKAEESTIGRTLAGDDVVHSRDWRRDPRFKEGGYADVVPRIRSFVNMPLLYHGAAVGCLNFEWQKPRAYTATDVQRVRQIADYVTPVVQTERWLRAIADLRERLQFYNFDPRDRSEGRFIGRVATEIHDVLAPAGTLLLFEFGFNPQWAMCIGVNDVVSSDDVTNRRCCREIEDEFMSMFSAGTAYVDVPMRLRDSVVGRIVLATRRDRDELTQPSLTTDREQQPGLGILVKDALLDLHRVRFGSIIHSLHSTDIGAFSSEVHWLRALRQKAHEVGIRGLSVYPDKTGKFHDEAIASTGIDIAAVRNAIWCDVGGLRVVRWTSTASGSDAVAVVELELPLCGEKLYFEIERSAFDAELSGELPWKVFFNGLADAADAALMRIRDVEFVEDAAMAPFYNLLLHELRSEARKFQGHVEWMEQNLPEIRDLPTEDRKRQYFDALKRSAANFTELSKAMERPAATSVRSTVWLREVRERVERVYAGRLAAPGITLQWNIPNHYVIDMPPHLAFVVLLGFVQNAREAIGDATGFIHVRSEQVSDDVLIHIDDTGVGVGEGLRRSIGKIAITTKGLGRGRGLYMARRALHLHKGDWYLSDPPSDVTTRFTIRLPRS